MTALEDRITGLDARLQRPHRAARHPDGFTRGRDAARLRGDAHRDGAHRHLAGARHRRMTAMRDHGRVTFWSAPLAAGPVHGVVAVPGSKSVTNRALLLAALSDGLASVSGAPAAARHRADGRRAARPRACRSSVDGEHVTVAAPRRAARRRHRRLRARRHRHAVRAARRRACRRPGRVRRRRRAPANARWRTVLDALRALGRRHRGRRAAVHPARHRRAARRRRRDRRVGVVAVRLRAAALRRAVRQGRHRAPRRQAGALAAAHRHDRGHAARPPGSTSTTASANTWRVAPGPIAARRLGRRARPLQRRRLPRRGRRHRRTGHGRRAGPRRSTQPGDGDPGRPGRGGVHGRAERGAG